MFVWGCTPHSGNKMSSMCLLHWLDLCCQNFARDEIVSQWSEWQRSSFGPLYLVKVCNANNFSIMSRWKEDMKDKQKIIWRVFYLKGSKKGTWFHCFRTKLSGGQMVIFINYFCGFFPTFLLCLLRCFLQIVSIELFFYDKLFWSVIKCIIWLVNNKRKN